jgi:alpha-glucosidase
MQFLGNALSHKLDGQRLTIEVAGGLLALELLAPDLCHLRFQPEGTTIRPSIAVVKTDWAPVPAKLAETPDLLRFTSDALTVEVQLNPVRLRFLGTDGGELMADGAGIGWREGQVTWEQTVRPCQHFYGFGQKLGHLDKRGKAMTLWTTDEPYHAPDIDQLYQAIPFHIAICEGAAYGLFLDCTAKVEYDIAKERPDRSLITLHTPVLEGYLFAGPHPKTVLSRYTELTGRMELPPKWALGYQQCRWSYYPESRVREIATELRERRLPSDAIVLDIDYMDGYRVFTWDHERFPDPKKLMDDLRAQGFRVITIVDPGVKVDPGYAIYDDGLAKGVFVRYADGRVFEGTVWPGMTAFPDFTRAGVRQWWGEQHKGALLDQGVAGIWNDMNEPSTFARSTFALETVQGERGAELPHEQWHNAYGLLMSKATFEGLKRLRPNERPFVLTRSGYAGIQRYSAVWMGDNHSWWVHLFTHMPILMGMGLSGVPFVGCDVGGFSGDSNGELLARWTQVGALTPFFRNHAAQGTRDQEPWAFGPEIEAICRRYMELRYELMPFLYNEFRRAAQTGLPIMRPLLLEYPIDPAVANLSDQFMVGQDLMAAPIYHPGADHRMVYLPAGAWLDFWTGERTLGPTYKVVEAPLETMPIFVREGAILPLSPIVQHTGEPVEELILAVWGEREGELTLYEDDGETFGYQSGAFSQTQVRWTQVGDGWELAVGAPVGGFTPARTKLTLRFHGLTGRQLHHEGALLPTERRSDGALEATIAIPPGGGQVFTLT